MPPQPFQIEIRRQRFHGVEYLGCHYSVGDGVHSHLLAGIIDGGNLSRYPELRTVSQFDDVGPHGHVGVYDIGQFLERHLGILQGILDLYRHVWERRQCDGLLQQAFELFLHHLRHVFLRFGGRQLLTALECLRDQVEEPASPFLQFLVLDVDVGNEGRIGEAIGVELDGIAALVRAADDDWRKRLFVALVFEIEGFDELQAVLLVGDDHLHRIGPVEKVHQGPRRFGYVRLELTRTLENFLDRVAALFFPSSTTTFILGISSVSARQRDLHGLQCQIARAANRELTLCDPPSEGDSV